MLQKLLGVAGVSPLLIASALSAARAADIPLKAPPLAPVPYSWIGFYIGGLLGGGFGENHSSYSGFDPGDTPPSVSANGSGVVAGAEAGYNRQFGTWLAGLEADVAYTHIDGTASSVSVNGVTQPTEQDLNWLATVRGRLGVLPTERLLLFVTGGAAFGGVSLSSSLGPASGACGPGNSCGSGSTSATRTGWTLGGGIEYAVSDWFSLKAEYLYVDLGSLSLTYPITLAVSQSTTNAQFRDSVVRAGLNIRLGPQH